MRLRTKLPLLVVALAVAVGALFALWVRVSTQTVIRDEARLSALREFEVSSREYLATGISNEVATLDDPDAPAELLRRAGDGELVTWLDDASGAAWVAAPAADRRVLVVHTSWSSGLDVLRRIDRNLALGVLALSALSGMGAFLTTRSVSRRLRRAEGAAASIAGGDLGVRVSEAVGARGASPTGGDRGGDEVTQLARTIDDLAIRMQERLAAEKRVTADIAHDLRTPITGLLAAASLLPEGRPSELIRSQIERLRRLVEDLLEVARLDETDQRLDVDEVSTRSLAARAISAAEVPDVALVVRANATVDTDARRVERVLVNLLANAARHGAPPLTCEVDGHSIAIVDTGPGFPEDLVADGPRRFRTGATERGTGHGLGLTIAAGQARALGATLAFSNEAAGGARATLTLP